MTNVVVFSEN